MSHEAQKKISDLERLFVTSEGLLNIALPRPRTLSSDSLPSLSSDESDLLWDSEIDKDVPVGIEVPDNPLHNRLSELGLKLCTSWEDEQSVINAVEDLLSQSYSLQELDCSALPTALQPYKKHPCKLVRFQARKIWKVWKGIAQEKGLRRDKLKFLVDATPSEKKSRSSFPDCLTLRRCQRPKSIRIQSWSARPVLSKRYNSCPQ